MEDKTLFDNRSEYMKEYARYYRATHKEEIYDIFKKWKRGLKEEILTHYGGGKCACVECGFDVIVALTIDHIENNGAEHRRTLKEAGTAFTYTWLKREGFPEGFQTLCMNCQWIKKFAPTPKIKPPIPNKAERLVLWKTWLDDNSKQLSATLTLNKKPHI